jgi:hypothetical protein
MYRDATASVRSYRDRLLSRFVDELGDIAPLVRVIAHRRARQAAAASVALALVAAGLYALVAADPWPAVFVAAVGPTVLVPFAAVLTAVYYRRALPRRLHAMAHASDDPAADVARLERFAPKRWLAAMAERSERWSSVAALTLAALAPLLATPLLLVVMWPLQLGLLAVLIEMALVIGAWIQPFVLLHALFIPRRPAVLLFALLPGSLLLAIPFGFGATLASLLGGSVQIIAFCVGQERLQRRLMEERALYAAR